MTYLDNWLALSFKFRNYLHLKDTFCLIAKPNEKCRKHFSFCHIFSFIVFVNIIFQYFFMTMVHIIFKRSAIIFFSSTPVAFLTWEHTESIWCLIPNAEEIVKVTVWAKIILLNKHIYLMYFQQRCIIGYKKKTIQKKSTKLQVITAILI